MGAQPSKTDKPVNDTVKKPPVTVSAMQSGIETESLAQLADPLTLQRAVLDPGGLSPRAMPGLQRSFGNQYVQMMLNGVAQRESPDDVAAQIQAQVSADHGPQPGNGGSSQVTQRASGDGGGMELSDSTSDAIGREASRGGKSLPQDAQVKLKQNLGISNPESIQIHHDPKSDALAQSLGARAFTTGGDIFFRQGEYDPGTTRGQRLLYHESVHTMQQGGAKQKSAQPKMTVTPSGDQYEQEADEVAEQALAPEQGQPRLTPPDTSDIIPNSEFPIQMEEKEGEEEKEDSEKEQKEKTKDAKQGAKKEEDEKKKEAENQGKSSGEEEKAKKEEKAGSQLPKKPKTPQEKLTPKPDTSALGDIDGDYAAEHKFDPDTFEPEEPDTGPLLPNWDQLASGTVQLQANVRQEYDYHTQLSDEGFGELGTTAAGEAEGVEIESEPIDQADMANKALAEGILGGMEEGATTFLADQAVEIATAKIPYADGLINLVQIARDPNQWLHDNVFAIGDGAKAIVSGFKGIGDESTGWGIVAAVLESVISIIDFVNSIIGLINVIFTIILFISKMMVVLSNLMIGLAPVGFPPVFPFSWTPAAFGPVLSLFSAIISFLEPVNDFISTIANVLNAVKFGLQPIVIFLRYMDLRECKADPEKLKEKQAKLKDTTTGFTSSVTVGVMNKTKDAGINAYQKRKLRKETKGELNDLDALEGASKPKKGDDETENDFQTRKSQAEQDFDAAKQRYVEAHGEAPERKHNESEADFEQRKKKAADEFYKSAKPPTVKGFVKGAAKIALLGVGINVAGLAKLKNVAKPFTKKGRASIKQGLHGYVSGALKEHRERTGGGTFMKPGKAQERTDYIARAKRSHAEAKTKRQREETTRGEHETATGHVERRRGHVTEKERGKTETRDRLTHAQENVTHHQNQVTQKRKTETDTGEELTQSHDSVTHHQGQVTEKSKTETEAHEKLTQAQDNVTHRQQETDEREHVKKEAEHRKDTASAEVISHKRKLDDQNEIVRDLDRQIATRQKSAQTDEDRAEIERLQNRRESAQQKADELTIEHTKKQNELATAREEDITARKNWYDAEQALTRAEREKGEAENAHEKARQEHETAKKSLTHAREQEDQARDAHTRATQERQEAERLLTHAQQEETESREAHTQATQEHEEAQELLDRAQQEERERGEAHRTATQERQEAEAEVGRVRGTRPKILEGMGKEVGGLPKWLGGEGDIKHKAWWLSVGKHGGQRHGPGATGPGGKFVLGLAKPSTFLGDENTKANSARSALDAYHNDNTQIDQLETAKQTVYWDLFSPQHYRDQAKKLKYTKSNKSALQTLANRLDTLRTEIESAYSSLGVGAGGAYTTKKKKLKITAPQIWGPGDKDQTGITGFTKANWNQAPGSTAYTVSTAYAANGGTKNVTALTWEGNVLQPDVTPKKLKLDPAMQRGVKYKDSNAWSANKVDVAYEYQPVGKKVSRPTGSEIDVQIAFGFNNYLGRSDEEVVEKLNEPPQFAQAPADETINADALYSGDVKISGDDDPELKLTALQKPDWLSLGSLTRGGGKAQTTISGTPQQQDVGSHTVKLRVEDRYGKQEEHTYTLVVSAAQPGGGSVSPKLQRSPALSGGNGRGRSQIIQAKRDDEEQVEGPGETQAKSIQLAPSADEQMAEPITSAPGFGLGALDLPDLAPPPQAAPVQNTIQLAPAEDDEPQVAPDTESEDEEGAALDEGEMEQDEAAPPLASAPEEEGEEEAVPDEEEVEPQVEAEAEAEEDTLAEFTETEEEGGEEENVGAAGYASLAAQAHQVRLYSLLPPPPEGVIEQIQGDAAAYSQLDAEEYDLYQQREEIGGLVQHGQGQMVELQGVRTLNAANQAGVAAHQRDVETQLQAQDEMANASAAQEGQAKKTAGEGEKGSNFLTKIFGKIMAGLGFGGAAGTGGGGGESQSEAMKSGTQNQAQNTQAAATLTKDAQGLSKQRTGETTQVKGEAQQVQDDLSNFDDQMLGEQQNTQEGIGELEDAGGMNEEQLDNVQSEKERLRDEHAEAWDEAQSWAEEHRTIREEVFSQLEADLAAPPAEPEAVEELAEV